MRKVCSLAVAVLLMVASCTSGGDGDIERGIDDASNGTQTSSTGSPGGPDDPAETVTTRDRGEPDRAATGAFEVIGTELFDPDGYRFIPVGTNMNGPHSFFDVPTRGRAVELSTQWGFNTIRLVTCAPGGCEGGTQPDRGDNDLEGIVDEYTGSNVVVMIEYHGVSPGQDATAADIAAAIEFWTPIAQSYGDNPWVWFNLYNEPESTFHDYARNDGTTATQRWRDQHQPVIDAIRASGATNIIVVDDTQAGQGAADWWSVEASPADQSGVLTEGANLVDSVDRLVFSVHAYDVWGFPNDNDATCATRYTDEQRDARFRSYVQRVRDAGHVLVVGELGFRDTDSATEGVSFHGEGGQHPPCGSTGVLSAETVYRVAPDFELGILTWHGFALTDDGPQAWELDGTPPGNLTYLGELHHAYVCASNGSGTTCPGS